MLCSGIELYNRYLLGWKVASLPVAVAGLAGRHPSPPSWWGHAVFGVDSPSVVYSGYKFNDNTHTLDL